MSKILITGSTDGLGWLAARMLIEQGHQVILHARNADRAKSTQARLDKPTPILIGELSDLAATRQLAAEASAHGPLDAIIHNAGILKASPQTIFRVNVLAPYLLAAGIPAPARSIFLGSSMHHKGEYEVESLSLDSGVDYSTSKLYLLMLSFALAKRWPDKAVNTVDPGWVPTKMGGPQARDSLEEGAQTQIRLATGSDTCPSGQYLHHDREVAFHPIAGDIKKQEALLQRLEALTGTPCP